MELTTMQKILFEESINFHKKRNVEPPTEEMFLREFNIDDPTAAPFYHAMERYAKLKWEEGARETLKAHFELAETMPIPDFKP